MNYAKYNKTSLLKMDINLDIVYRYAGKDSILNTVCDDKKIDITDIDSKLVTLEDRSLIIGALQAYEKKLWATTFTDVRKERLKYLDKYLDIPALALFYSKPDYKLLSRFISNEYDQIPVDLFKSDKILEDFYKYGGEKELDWMLKHRLVHLDDGLPGNLAEFDNLKCLRYVHEHHECILSYEVLYRAAYFGSLECLRYAHQHGCPWDEYTTSAAARNGHLECLKYMHKNGCKLDEETIYEAVSNGHLNCLRYAHVNGCSWNVLTAGFAATYGHLNCLRYLHENGCPWDDNTTFGAVKYGHLNCLRYLRENKCPWGEHTTFWAAMYGQLECLQYLYENKCPIDINECLRISHKNCKEWLLKLKNQK